MSTNTQHPNPLRQRFGNNLAIIIDLDNRDADGKPGISLYNQQYHTIRGQPRTFHIAIVEHNQTSTLTLTDTVLETKVRV